MSAYLEEWVEYLPEASDTTSALVAYTGEYRRLGEQEKEVLVNVVASAWVEGKRHALAMAVAGAMAREGFSEADAESVIQSVCSGRDREVRDRLQAVRSSYREAREGKPVLAFGELKEALSEQGFALFQSVVGRPRSDVSPEPTDDDPYRVPFRLTERRDFPSFPMLIEGLMPSDPRGSVCYLCGLSQSFKSYLALDWACHISQGMEWMKFPCTKAQVLYVAAEGSYKDILSRLRAWEAHHQTKAENLYCRLSPINILDPGATEKVIRGFSRVDNFRPRLVILDTLSQCAGSADENSAKDARAIYANAKRFGEAYGSTVLVVAHRGKSDGNIMRGSSAFFDDSDAVYQMVRPSWQSGGLDCTLNVTKIKSGKLVIGHEMNARVVEWQDGERRGSDLVLVQRVLRSAFEGAPKLY